MKLIIIAIVYIQLLFLLNTQDISQKSIEVCEVIPSRGCQICFNDIYRKPSYLQSENISDIDIQELSFFTTQFINCTQSIYQNSITFLHNQTRDTWQCLQSCCMISVTESIIINLDENDVQTYIISLKACVPKQIKILSIIMMIFLLCFLSSCCGFCMKLFYVDRDSWDVKFFRNFSLEIIYFIPILRGCQMPIFFATIYRFLSCKMVKVSPQGKSQVIKSNRNIKRKLSIRKISGNWLQSQNKSKLPQINQQSQSKNQLGNYNTVDNKNRFSFTGLEMSQSIYKNQRMQQVQQNQTENRKGTQEQLFTSRNLDAARDKEL